jgi:hypothetical protein
VVQCYLNDNSPEGATQEEVCCMLKNNAGRWGVSGIAFQASPQQPPIILNFEKPAQSGPSQQPMAEFPNQPQPSAPSDNRYPVQTAQPPGAPIAR